MRTCHIASLRAGRSNGGYRVPTAAQCNARTVQHPRMGGQRIVTLSHQNHAHPGRVAGVTARDTQQGNQQCDYRRGARAHAAYIVLHAAAARGQRWDGAHETVEPNQSE